MKAATVLAGLALAFALAVPTVEPGLQDIQEAADAWCETDTDCMRHCPPPADDPDCDGGPQDEAPGRGDYGSQP